MDAQHPVATIACPHCAGRLSNVTDSRPTKDDTTGETAIRRRRKCTDCGTKYSTTEVVGTLTSVSRNRADLLQALRALVVAQTVIETLLNPPQFAQATPPDKNAKDHINESVSANT